MSSINQSDYQDTHLDRQLDVLREALQAHNTPAAVEKQLQQAFARRHGHAAPGRRWLGRAGQWFAPAVGLAAATGMAAWVSLSPMSNAGMVVENPAVVVRDDGAPFIALQPMERITAEPEPRLIETAVPRSMLASLGLPVNPEVAGEAMHAQMLVSADGQPLAMRLTQ